MQVALGVIRQKVERVQKQTTLDCRTEHVIGLTNLRAGAIRPIAILILDRCREEGGTKSNNRDVMFIDATDRFEAYSKSNETDIEQIFGLSSVYNDKTNVDNTAYLANAHVISANNFNLSVSRYVSVEDIDLGKQIKIGWEQINRLTEDLKRVEDDLRECNDQLKKQVKFEKLKF